MSSSNILHCQEMVKKFGETEVLKKISIEIHKGEIFGLLGGNGVGKSTLIKCILGLLKPQQGKIFFHDRPLKESDIRNSFGFLPENFTPYGNLSARELLRILAWGKGIDLKEVDSLLERVNLSAKKNLQVRKFSRGMIQRLGLAIGMLKKAELVILDEPTLGLDVVGQRQILDFLKDLRKEGTTIFFTSHILAQVEELCDRIATLQQGKVSFVGSVAEFKQKHDCNTLEEAFLREIKSN